METAFEQALCRFITPETVFMGIGNCLRGDDGLGPVIVSILSDQGFKVVDAGTVPENHIGTVKRLSPESILIIDAVHLDRESGAAELLDSEDISGSTGFTTHTLSPVLVMEMLEGETSAPVKLLAIQPETLAFGAPLSASVTEAVKDLTDLIQRCLKKSP